VRSSNCEKCRVLFRVWLFCWFLLVCVGWNQCYEKLKHVERVEFLFAFWVSSPVCLYLNVF
jgi:hypothetical protein